MDASVGTDSLYSPSIAYGLRAELTMFEMARWWCVVDMPNAVQRVSESIARIIDGHRPSNGRLPSDVMGFGRNDERVRIQGPCLLLGIDYRVSSSVPRSGTVINAETASEQLQE